VLPLSDQKPSKWLPIVFIWWRWFLSVTYLPGYAHKDEFLHLYLSIHIVDPITKIKQRYLQREISLTLTPGITSLIYCLVLYLTRSSATAKSTAQRRAYLVYFMAFIGRQSTDQQLINHFYPTGRNATEFHEITLNNGHYAVEGHSRSAISLPIESQYTTSY